MRILAWNVGPRSPRAILGSFRALDREHPAKIIALFEASRRALVALLVARYPHRRVICHRTDVVAIIPRGRPRPRVEVIGHDYPWRGPHMGRVKRGRRWLLLVWDDEAFLFVHRVSGGPSGPNAAAWRVESRIIRDVCTRWDMPQRLAIVGDHNATAHELHDEYADLGLTLLPVVAKVDACAARGFHGGGTRLGNHGSDHVAIMWRLR